MGTVYLVGAGPWDSGLLTLRGREVLARAGVVLYDALCNPALLDHCPETAEQIFVGKRGGRSGHSQEQINALLLEHAQRHAVVVRLKGGDPMLFGRGSEEALALVGARVPFEVVPGVSSAVAAVFAGIPLTHRGVASTVTYATAHASYAGTAVDFEALGAVGGTLVLFMGVRTLTEVTEALIRGGREPQTPVALVRWGSRADQATVTGTLTNIADEVEAAGLKPPALVVVGEVVDLRKKLAWFEHRPLFGRRVLVTRPEADRRFRSGAAGSHGADARQDATLGKMLAEAGAEVLPIPTIAIGPPQDWGPCDTAISHLDRYAWVVLTSPRAVDAFLDRLEHANLDSRALAGAQLCTVGPSTTARLRERGLQSDRVPEDASADGIVAALTGSGSVLSGVHVLMPRAAEGRDVVPDGLSSAGAQVDVVPVYRTRTADFDAPGLAALLESGRIDAVAFASGSAVRGLCDGLGAIPGAPSDHAASLLGRARIAVIGRATAAVARELGLQVDIQPDPGGSLRRLADAIIAALSP